MKTLLLLVLAWLLVGALGQSTTSTAATSTATTTAEKQYCSINNQCESILGKSLDRTRVTLAKSDVVTVMLKILYTNTTVNVTGTYSVNLNYSAMFFPTVDSYTKLTIPRTWANITALAKMTVAVDLIHAGERYTLPGKLWYNAVNNRYAEFRTAIITLLKGVPTLMEWEETKCYYSDCGCIDNLCPVACDDKLSCNIQVHLAWAGTDSGGQYLQSSSTSATCCDEQTSANTLSVYSIYKMENVI